VSKALHERIIEGKQIGVLTLIESLLLKITNELVTDLMPQSVQSNKYVSSLAMFQARFYLLFLKLKRNGSDAIIECGISHGMVF